MADYCVIRTSTVGCASSACFNDPGGIGITQSYFADPYPLGSYTFGVD